MEVTKSMKQEPLIVRLESREFIRVRFKRRMKYWKNLKIKAK